MKENFINTALIVAISAIIASIIVLGTSGGGTFGAASRAPNVDAEFSTVTATTGTFSSTATFGGFLTTNAGLLQSYVNATSTTATSMTMVQADILNYNTLLITPTVGALTYTLPATSTLTSFVPTAGDRVDQCWYNATSTTAATVTVVAGAGIDLERTATSTISGSAGVIAIGARNSACFTFIREADTDISVLMHNFIDAD